MKKAFLVIVAALCAIAWSYQSLPMTECAWCHRTPSVFVSLQRHHIQPQERFPELTNVKTNLIVLCSKCHFVLGHRCNTHTYNPDVLALTVVYTNCIPNVKDGTP